LSGHSTGSALGGKIKYITYMVHNLLKHTRLILISGIIFALLAFVISFIFPKYYSAESQVLIISRSASGVDPYTQSKAAERVGENLAQVMGTTDFYNKVSEAQSANFNRERWTTMNDRTRRKEWARDVNAEVVYGTGLLRVTVFSNTPDDTIALSEAVTDTLMTRGWEYVGGDVSIKTVNSPLLSQLPARPNFIINTILGFALGGLFAGWWVVTYKRGVFGRL